MFPNNDLPAHPDTNVDLPEDDRGASLDLPTPDPKEPAISPNPTKTHYVFVDLENVRPQITAIPSGKVVKLKIFVGTERPKVPLDVAVAAQAYGPDAEYIRVDGQAENALDFYIAYYIGHLAGSLGNQASDACFHIISKDRGFDPLIAHLKAKNIFCHRSRSFEEIPFDGILPPGSNSEQAATITDEEPTGRTRRHGRNRTVATRKGRKKKQATSKIATSWDKVAVRYPPGMQIEGVVRNLRKFGAVIEIEKGINGLLHVSNISWVREIGHPSEVLKMGEKVKCVILKVEQERKRVELGLKQLANDPWKDDISGRYRPNDIKKGKVTRFSKLGVFVELEHGLEGLLRISELADQKVDSPEGVVKAGDEIEVRILSVDVADRKISLSRKRLNKPDLLDEGTVAILPSNSDS